MKTLGQIAHDAGKFDRQWHHMGESQKAEWERIAQAVIDAQQVAAPYDQQALELCNKCGWKAIMPGEPCFVCNLQTEALSDFDMRGVLASNLLCWHRLTDAEAQNLICFFEKVKAQQVAVPQAMEDLTGVTVCCGDFAKCHRPCTPRGQWMATKAYQVTVPAGMAIVPTEALLGIKNRVNTLATLSLKAERYSVGRAIKQDIADMIAAAQGAKP